MALRNYRSKQAENLKTAVSGLDKEPVKSKKNKASTVVVVSVIVFGVFMAICNFVKDGLNAWVPQILKDTYGFGDSLSIVLTLVMPMFGLFGSMTVVALSKAVKNDVAVNLILFVAFAANKTGEIHMKKEITILKDEVWYLGVINEAEGYPLTERSDYFLDLTFNRYFNQVNPIFLSNKGRYIWLEDGGKVRFYDGKIIVEAEEIDFFDGGKTLKDASVAASEKHYPPSGKMPDERVFSAPQYCSWVAFLCRQNQKDLLTYAHSIVDNGFKPGILIIDDTWQRDYGVWDFNKEYFPTPKEMVDELHDLGFLVVLWLAPYISPDNQISEDYTLSIGEHLNKDTLIMNGEDDPRIVHWWDGFSVALDFKKQAATDWINLVTERLTEKYGIDGFKLDGGDPIYYGEDYKDANLQNSLWIDKVNVPIKEARSCFKLAGKPILQRLNDKKHAWKSGKEKNFLGLSSLLPCMLTQGLAGYTFGCADMIGGGAYCDFVDKSRLNNELIIRWCEASSLFPMVQFSYDVWNHEQDGLKDCCKKAMALREKFLPYITELIKESAKTGVPAIRYLEYEFPGQGLEKITDEFMLGDKYLVAPVLEKGKTEREVIFPSGRWQDIDDGKIYEGKAKCPAPIDKLPVFLKLD